MGKRTHGRIEVVKRQIFIYFLTNAELKCKTTCCLRNRCYILFFLSRITIQNYLVTDLTLSVTDQSLIMISSEKIRKSVFTDCR